MKKIAIIGGGASGLCAAKHLLHSKYTTKFEPVIFEQGSCFGGTWVYEDFDINQPRKDVFSSMYRNLRTNVPKQSMCFPDFPFPDDMPSFMHHSMVQEYLQDYAKYFNLESVVKFRTRVKKVSPLLPVNGKLDDSSRFIMWKVEFEKLENSEHRNEIFDGVVVCNGHYSVPSVPNIQRIENFKGDILHSHYYRHPEDFKGKSVVILGNGPSGRDIMVELSNYCSKIFYSHRKTKSNAKFPENVLELPAIKHISDIGDVVFENSFTSSVDVIIFCTGYCFSFPFLSKECEVFVKENGRIVTPVYYHLFHTKYPSLVMVGLPWKCAPMPLMHQQCAFLTSVFANKTFLPSEEKMNVCLLKEMESLRQKGLPLRLFHQFGSKQYQYNDELAELCGNKKNPNVMKNIYEFNNIKRNSNLFSYKNNEFKIIDDENFQVFMSNKTGI